MNDFDAYLEALPAEQRQALQRLCDIVTAEVPEAVASVSYGMLTYKYKAKPLIYFGAFKHHMSIFPTPGPTNTLAAKLKDYKSSKGTIQFTLDSQLPKSLVVDILKARKQEINA